METTSLRDLQAALQRKSGFEFVDHSFDKEKIEISGQLRIMGRQRKDAMGVNIGNWLLVVRSLLQRSGKTSWCVDISKQYFLRGNPGEELVMYGWRLIFQSIDDATIGSVLDDIINTVMKAPHTARGELTEYPVHGATHRNELRNGKGAGGIREGIPAGPRR